MIPKLENDRLSAQLSAINTLLSSVPADDYMGRAGLEARRAEIIESLARLGEQEDHQARVVLSFGGQPVFGSTGISTKFAADALNSFQDIVTKVWGIEQGAPLAATGPIRDAANAQLHITNLLHGSFGFLLEELDANGEPLFDSRLKQATNRVADVVESFADEDEGRFSRVIEQINPRVFHSVRRFFVCLHSEDATLRIVEGERDKQLDKPDIERAWYRAEKSNVDEQEESVIGQLLGVIPIGRRFEFVRDGGGLIRGKVGDAFSNNYLERISTEQIAGKRWVARVNKKTIERSGREPQYIYTLLTLEAMPEEPPHEE
jgi:hypothetical protein